MGFVAGIPEDRFERQDAEIALRKRVEEILRANEAFVKSVMNAVMDAILTTDSSGKLETMNAQPKKIFGYDEEELVGESLVRLGLVKG